MTRQELVNALQSVMNQMMKACEDAGYPDHWAAWWDFDTDAADSAAETVMGLLPVIITQLAQTGKEQA